MGLRQLHFAAVDGRTEHPQSYYHSSSYIDGYAKVEGGGYSLWSGYLLLPHDWGNCVDF